MFFIEVKPEELIVGEKYRIKTSRDNIHYYTAIFKQHNGTIPVFDRFIIHSDTERMKIRVQDNVPKCLYYYAFVPQKERIQQAMEQRALDKILKRLINDDFSW